MPSRYFPPRAWTIADPPPDRWVPDRKAKVVQAIRDGKLTIEQAIEKFGLTREELSEWMRFHERFGENGLRASKLRLYRNAEKNPWP